MSWYMIFGFANSCQYPHERSSHQYRPWSWRLMSGSRNWLMWACRAGYVWAKTGFRFLAGFGPRPWAILARLQGDHPQAGPIGSPARNVLPTNIGLDDFGTARIGRYQGILGRRVDEECIVTARLNAHERLDAGQLGERNPPLPNLCQQILHAARLKLPWFSAQLCGIDFKTLLVNLGIQVVDAKLLARDGTDPCCWPGACRPASWPR